MTDKKSLNHPDGCLCWTCRTEPTNPAAPATCSEVVERLAKCVSVTPLKNAGGNPHATFDRAKAEAILHSWRERRVQELEMLIARAAFFVSFTKAEFNKREDFDGIHKANCWAQDAEKLLKSDEWREQGRKGANHE